MGLFAFYEGDSALHRRHPLVKLAALGFILMVATPDLKLSTPWLDPGVPLVFLGLVSLSLSLFGRVPLAAVSGRVLGLGLLTLPLLIFQATTFDAPQQAGNLTPLIGFGPWTATREGLASGLALSLRALTALTCALAFVMTTNPADFTTSLMQQGRVSYRLGYAILGRARFLALLDGELQAIRAAQRIRGVGHPGSLFEQFRRYSAPLRAASNRYAKRAALARESRGFGGDAERTLYRQTPITAIDWSFLMAVVGVTLVLIEALIFVGMVDGIAPGTGT